MGDVDFQISTDVKFISQNKVRTTETRKNFCRPKIRFFFYESWCPVLIRRFKESQVCYLVNWKMSIFQMELLISFANLIYIMHIGQRCTVCFLISLDFFLQLNKTQKLLSHQTLFGKFILGLSIRVRCIFKLQGITHLFILGNFFTFKVKHTDSIQ